LNGPHAKKETISLQEICLFLGEAKGHDPQELTVNHVKSIGLTHSQIHKDNFVEDIFKGVLFFEEVLKILPDDLVGGKRQVEQEEKKKILQEQF